MKLPFRACSAVLCLSGLVACSQTPAQTADDRTDVTPSTTTASTEPAMAPMATDPSPVAPSPASKGALATTADNRATVTAHGSDVAPQPVPAATPPAATPPAAPPGTAPDNTKVNKRDTDSAALTPMDQGNGKTDLDITQQIRKAVMADGSLSFTAKNVKIITVKGKVTLRGPVNSDAERSAIEAAARKVAGAQVDNQIEVKK